VCGGLASTAHAGTHSPVDVRYRVLYSLGQKNHNMHHRTSTDSIIQSMCDIGFCILLARKITTCIIAHRPMSIRQSMCDIGFCILLARKSQHASSHIDRFDYPVDVRYRVLYSLGQKNHNVHHRTSTDSIIQSMCDIWLCILLARKSQRASSHIEMT
jgi:hypothetical protein